MLSNTHIIMKDKDVCNCQCLQNEFQLANFGLYYDKPQDFMTDQVMFFNIGHLNHT